MRLHRIQTGSVRLKANQVRRSRGRVPSIAGVLFGREWSEWLPIYAWAIEHPDGVIVVDTGEIARTADPGYLPSCHPYCRLAVEFDVSPDDEIGPRLRELGIGPETDVQTVVMTHLHADHAGGLHPFRNSEILINRMEFLAARGFAGKLAGYLPHRWTEWLAPTF